MRIIILGSTGMLGFDLKRKFENFNLILPTTREGFDIRRRQDVMSLVDYNPDIIINAAAFTNVAYCENKEGEGLANQINGFALIYLCELAIKTKAILVHYSTDFIFDGNLKIGYKEDIKKHMSPVNNYGKSKLLGETIIRNYACGHTLNYYIIRTSWLFGLNRKNFVDNIIDYAREGLGSVEIPHDQYGKPTYTADLANQTKFLLNNKENYDFGIYHITNEGVESWFGFASEIIDCAVAFGIIESPLTIIPRKSDEITLSIQRPKYSILLNTKLPPLRDYKEALIDYLFKKYITG